MNPNALIQKYGQALTIKRLVDVTTRGYIKSTKLNDVQARFNFSDLIARADSTIVAGDVLYDGTTYYLVAQVGPAAKGGVTQYLAGLLLTCNASVTIQKVAAGAFTTVKANVRCLITKSRLATPDDETGYRDRTRGNQAVNYIYMAASEGLLPSHFIVDGSRSLKVLNEISPYMAGGIVEAQAVIEEA